MKSENITRRTLLEQSVLTAATASTLPAFIAESAEVAPTNLQPEQFFYHPYDSRSV